MKSAVKIFFEKKKLCTPMNCTLVALIPKSKEAMRMRGMRPISCCSTISKIITARMRTVISDPSQSAFIPGRNIQDNVIMAQELMRR